ncbi:hypothetical protein A0257_17095 [Hymenobacter psoromatis]|nr:hypothetical protein A0257_17095 [Hymenobacter psoromatis]
MTPNPASSELTVTNTAPDLAAQYQLKDADKAHIPDMPFDADLYDMYGKKVKSLTNVQGKGIFDVSSLPAGLYNLRVGKGKDMHMEHVQIVH